MVPVLFGIGAALLVGLAASGGGPGEGGAPAADGDKPAAKPRPRRVMSSQEAFEAGKKARQAEVDAEAKERAAFEAKVDAAVARKMKAGAPPKVETPTEEASP